MKRSERKELVASVLRPYLTAKKDRTMLGQYKRIAPDAAGIVRTSWGFVETSRLSSSESFYEPSTNLQNISQTVGFEDELYRVRDVFIAPPGWTLLARDYDKAEAICLAAYSKDWDYYDLLISGADVHRINAANAFHGGDESKVTRLERNVNKNVTFASFYMAGIPTITRTVNKRADQIGRRLSESEVEELRDAYLEHHPQLMWYWGWVRNTLETQGYLENAFNFRRIFLDTDEHRRWKEGLAFFPQSTVACAINESLIEIFDSGVDEEDVCHTVLQVHDELLFVVRNEAVEEKDHEIAKIMERPFEVHGREIYIPSSSKLGLRWESHRSDDPEDDARMRETGVCG